MFSRVLFALPLLLMPSLVLAFSSSSAGNETTFGGFNANASNVGKYTLSTASDGRVLVSSPSRIPLAGGGSFPINVSGSISKPSAAAAIGRFLLKGSGVIGVLGLGAAAYQLAQDLGFTLDNSSGATVLGQPNPLAYQSTGSYWRAQNGSNNGYGWTPQAACRALAATAGAAYTGYIAAESRCTATLGGFPYGGNVTVSTSPYPCANGQWAVPGGTACTASQPTSVAPVSALEQAIVNQMVWPESSKLGEAVAEAIRLTDSVPVTSPAVTGPATVPGASSITVDEATGETTTTTQTVEITYDGPKVIPVVVTTTVVTDTATGAPIRQSTTTSKPVAELPVSPDTEPAPFAMPCGVAGTPPCGVKVDEVGTPVEVPADKFKPMLDEGKQAQEDLLDQVKADTDKSFFEPFTDLFVTPALASCVPLEIPGDRGVIDPCGTVDGARAIMAYIWALSGLALCLHMVRSAL